MNKVLFFFCTIVMLVCCPVVAGAANQASSGSVYAVWSMPAANRTAVIWYASRFGENWNKPVRLDIPQGLHVTPVIAADSKGLIWIVWIEQTADANLLRFARVQKGKIVATGRVLSGTREQSYAPAIVLDRQGRPWIAWSGVVGQYADIFSSRWTGDGWSKAVQVNPTNSTPDITPIMGRKENRIWVSWFGFDPTHRYVRFVAEWLDNSWMVDKKVFPSKDVKSFISKRMGTEIILPRQAAHRMMGAVFSGSANEIQSITERFIRFQAQEGK